MPQGTAPVVIVALHSPSFPDPTIPECEELRFEVGNPDR